MATTEGDIDAVFRLIDSSGDGTVSRAELAKAVRSSTVLADTFGVSHSLRDSVDGSMLYSFNAAFDAADANGDRRITKDELRAFMAPRDRASPPTAPTK